MSFCREGIFVVTICWKTTKFVFTLFSSLPVPKQVSYFPLLVVQI